MNKLVLALVFVGVSVINAVAEPVNVPGNYTTPATVAEFQAGWGPSVVGGVGKFYFNGDYVLADAGVFFGTAYTFADKRNNVNSAGLYLGPSSSLKNGVSKTSIDAMAYLNLYQTSEYGGYGIGIGTQLWQAENGFKFKSSTSFLTTSIKFR